MNSCQYYTRTKIDEEKITFIEVKETVSSIIPLRKIASGDAIVTHIGAYKRFKFKYDEKIWTTEHGNKHAIADDKSEAICMENISVSEEALEKGWDTYMQIEKRPYFIEI